MTSGVQRIDLVKSRLWTWTMFVGLAVLWGALFYEAGPATATVFILLVFIRMKGMGDATGAAITATRAANFATAQAAAAAEQLAAVQRERVEELNELRELREKLGMRDAPPPTGRPH